MRQNVGAISRSRPYKLAILTVSSLIEMTIFIFLAVSNLN